MKKKYSNMLFTNIFIEIIAVILVLIIFGIPLFFIIINSAKSRVEAAQMNIMLPSVNLLLENYKTVLTANNNMVIRAFLNSGYITILSVIGIVIVASMISFIMQRRRSKLLSIFGFLIFAGLIMPPSVVPTIWVLNNILLFKTKLGLILVELALSLPFAVLIYRGFLSTIPKEIDQAAIIDGCGIFRLFFSVIFPLLKPATATIIVLTSVTIFNDFTNPLYFLPGSENVTVQLSLYNFMSMYLTDWNLMFSGVVMISIPPLILFIFFNKKLVAGITAGAVKG
ncbi:MAG: carbohydrate ABC transporter permease [Clostridiales bacterium]